MELILIQIGVSQNSEPEGPAYREKKKKFYRRVKCTSYPQVNGCNTADPAPEGQWWVVAWETKPAFIARALTQR